MESVKITFFFYLLGRMSGWLRTTFYYLQQYVDVMNPDNGPLFLPNRVSAITRPSYVHTYSIYWSLRSLFLVFFNRSVRFYLRFIDEDIVIVHFIFCCIFLKVAFLCINKSSISVGGRSVIPSKALEAHLKSSEIFAIINIAKWHIYPARWNVMSCCSENDSKWPTWHFNHSLDQS